MIFQFQVVAENALQLVRAETAQRAALASPFTPAHSRTMLHAEETVSLLACGLKLRCSWQVLLAATNLGPCVLMLLLPARRGEHQCSGQQARAQRQDGCLAGRSRAHGFGRQ